MALPAQTELIGSEFERFSLADPQGQFELYDGRLVERPGMSVAHGSVMMALGLVIGRQLDPEEFEIRIQHARLKRSDRSYSIPDIVVLPGDAVAALMANPDQLDLYPDPVPFVAEVWSPLTGGYDIDVKIPGYRERGDLEIWRVHPYERRVVAWQRQPDGGYADLAYLGGVVELTFLPGVRIDLDGLFAGPGIRSDEGRRP
jgi:Uma2 family endonuclease